MKPYLCSSCDRYRLFLRWGIINNIWLKYVPVRVWELPFWQQPSSQQHTRPQNRHHLSRYSGKQWLSQFVGFFSCLIRSDYNFAVIFFCYFVWQQRKDALALKIVSIINILRSWPPQFSSSLSTWSLHSRKFEFGWVKIITTQCGRHCGQCTTSESSASSSSWSWRLAINDISDNLIDFFRQRSHQSQKSMIMKQKNDKYHVYLSSMSFLCNAYPYFYWICWQFPRETFFYVQIS